MTIIAAKFPGTCAQCKRKHIALGDQIESIPGEKGWKRVGCDREPLYRPRKPTQTSLPVPLDAEPRRRSPSDIIADEIARYKANPLEDTEWMGVEDFY